MLAFGLGLLVCLGGYLAGRALALWAGAGPGVRLLSSAAPASYLEAPRARRIAWRVAGPAGAYALCAALVAVALAFSGELVPSTTVDVHDGPAAAAGIESGDRIVAVGGARIERWDEAKAALAAVGPSRPIEVAVARAGEERRFTVTTGPTGKVGVSPRNERVARPAGQVLAQAAAAPLTTPIAYVQGLVATLTERESHALVGPVGIVRAVSSSSSSEPRRDAWLAVLLMALAFPAAAVWPATLVAEVVLRPRPPEGPRTSGELREGTTPAGR